MDTAGERKGGMNWEIRTDVDTLPWASLASPALLVGSLPLVPPGKPWKIASSWELAIKHRTLSSMLCNDLGGWVVGRGGGCGREVQEEGDICMHMADSLHCIRETNTIS